MNTFTWLIVGHLVGDWLLQNDWMAKGKKHGFLALPGLTHFAVYTIIILAALWLAGMGGSPSVYLLVGGAIFVSHWLMDATDIIDRWMHVFGQTTNTMVRVMVDQTFHILVLTVVAVWAPVK